MFTKSQLDQLEKLLESNNKKIIKGIYGEIKTTEQSLRQEIQTTEKSLHQEIQTTEVKLRQEIQASAHQVEEKLRHEIRQTEITLKQEIQTSNQQLEEKLSLKIIASQEDTIDAVSDIINTGFNMHEMRIKRIEEHLALPPIKQ